MDVGNILLNVLENIKMVFKTNLKHIKISTLLPVLFLFSSLALIPVLLLSDYRPISKKLFHALGYATDTRLTESRGVNPGGWGVATPQILGRGSWTGHDILLYPIMYRKYVRKW